MLAFKLRTKRKLILVRSSAANLTFAVCGGDCKEVLDLGLKEGLFSISKDFQAVIHPVVGHRINFSYDAPGAYRVMLDYLKKHGL
jgi:hypothetical protein